MSKRTLVLTLSSLPFALSLVIAVLFALCVSAEAQQPKAVPRIGFLAATPATRSGGCVIIATRVP